MKPVFLGLVFYVGLLVSGFAQCNKPSDVSISPGPAVYPCNEEYITLTGTFTESGPPINGSYSVSWYISSTPYLDGSAVMVYNENLQAGQNSTEYLASTSYTGWYILTIEDGFSNSPDCYAIDSVILKENLYPGVLGPDQQICEGDTPAIIFDQESHSGPNISYTIQWYFSDDEGDTWESIPDSDTLLYTETSPLFSTRLYKRGISTPECPEVSTEPMRVNVFSSEITGPDSLFLAAGSSQQITVAGSADYVWTGATEYLTIGNDSASPIVNAPDSDTAFFVNVNGLSGPSCAASKSIYVEVFSDPDQIISSGELQQGVPFQLFTPYENNTEYNWTTSGGVNIISGQDSNVVVLEYNSSTLRTTATPEACVTKTPLSGIPQTLCKQLDVILGNKAIDRTHIKVYPVPADEELTVGGLTERTSYKIYNVSGLISGEGVTSGKIDLSKFKKGVYILELYGVDHKLRIIKQ